MSYPIPNSFDNILSTDFFQTPYTNHFGSQADAESGVPYYFPGGEPSPAYTTYNEAPLLPTPPSLPDTFSSMGSAAALASAWNQSPDVLSDNLSQLSLEPNATNAQPAMAHSTTRRRGASSRLSALSRRTTSSRRSQTLGKMKKPGRAGCATQLVRLFQTRIGIEPLQSRVLFQSKNSR
jgi:hypothetical protein